MKQFKKQIIELPGLPALINLDLPEPLVKAFSDSLTQIEIAGYIDGRQSYRKLPKHTKANTIMSFADTDVSNWLDEHVGFSFDLPAVTAIQSFASEAERYSTTTISTMLEDLQSGALKAIESGLTWRDWLDQLQIPGYEDANPYHLRTNFDTAANGAYAAGIWHEVEQYKDVFPYLRYVTMEDELVREEHAELRGTIARVEDIFWATFMPPNGYNCRCSVEQLLQSEAEEDPEFGKEKLTPNIDPRFQKNTGQTLTVFS